MSRHADLASTPAMRAAANLRETLPIRTHTRAVAPEGSGGTRRIVKSRGASLIFGKGGTARPVVIAGKRYPSATEAARKLHKSTRTVYEWLRTGEARYD